MKHQIKINLRNIHKQLSLNGFLSSIIFYEENITEWLWKKWKEE